MNIFELAAKYRKAHFRHQFELSPTDVCDVCLDRLADEVHYQNEYPVIMCFQCYENMYRGSGEQEQKRVKSSRSQKDAKAKTPNRKST